MSQETGVTGGEKRRPVKVCSRLTAGRLLPCLCLQAESWGGKAGTGQPCGPFLPSIQVGT